MTRHTHASALGIANRGTALEAASITSYDNGSMDVEKLAVTKIVQMISRCTRLAPFIESNDKTLLTDGHIDVHSSSPPSKTTFQGRVDVQVKGRTLKGKPAARKFPLSKVDLTGYSRNQTTLYFIIYIDPRTFEETPFYILLTPFKILRLINDMGHQKTIGVPVRSFPSDPSRIEGIVRLALESNNEKPTMRIDAGHLKDLKSITLYTDGSVALDMPVTLTRDEYDFTLAIETSEGVALYIDHDLMVTPSEYMGETTDLTVSSGGFVFQNPVRQRVDKDTSELQLSDGLKLRISRLGSDAFGNVMLSLQATLEDRFNDLGFYLQCVDTKSFSINGAESDFELNSLADEGDLRDHFEYLTKLRSLLDSLEVDSSLVDLDALLGRRGQQLIDLHGVMVEGENVTGAHHEPGRILQPMGRWSLQLIVLEDADEGKWVCRDLFNPKLRHQFIATSTDTSGESRISRITPYDIVEPEHFPYTLNLHLNNLVQAYIDISHDPSATTYANATILKLIHAADNVQERKTEFLDAAQCLNDWLLSKQGNLAHHQINYWQIVARQTALSSEHRADIRSLRDEASRGEMEGSEYVGVACAILLGDEEEIHHSLSRLDEAALSVLREWPIWRLYSAADPLGD